MQEFRFPLSPEQSFRHIFFRFENSPYDCLLQIRDTSGFREFYVPIVTAEGEAPHIFETDVCGDSFELNLIPVAADLSEHINEFRANLEKDRTGGKLLSFFVSKAPPCWTPLSARCFFWWVANSASPTFSPMQCLTCASRGAVSAVSLPRKYSICFQYYTLFMRLIAALNSFRPRTHGLSTARSWCVRSSGRL